MDKLTNKQLYFKGLKNGIPIGLGYFAVAFSLGLTMCRVGFNYFQGFLTSALLNASAGEYGLIECVASGSLVTTVILITIISNARYFLMSCALSQKLEPSTKFFHRFIVGFFITDEFFSMCMSEKDYYRPAYLYGAVSFASPCWAIGTMFGVLVGEILPPILVSSLCVSLYGMFLASIIPPAKKSKVLILTIAGSFIVSYLFSIIPVLRDISDSARIIILTLIIATIVALVFPLKEENINKTENENLNNEVSGGDVLEKKEEDSGVTQ